MFHLHYKHPSTVERITNHLFSSASQFSANGIKQILLELRYHGLCGAQRLVRSQARATDGQS